MRESHAKCHLTTKKTGMLDLRYNTLLMTPKETLAPVPTEKAPWKEHTNASASAAVFLTDEHNRLLMVRDIDEHGGRWSPIAGFVDVCDNETPQDAAVREAKEEMDLDVQLDSLLGVWHYYADNDQHAVAYGKDAPPENTPANKAHMHIGYAYRGTILGGSFTMQKEEIQDWGFFTREEIEEKYRNGELKTPQYNYVGYQLWKNDIQHPLDVVIASRPVRATK